MTESNVRTDTTSPEPPNPPAPPEYPAYPVALPGKLPQSKSPVLAGFLSAMPGLGQVYIGHYVRGFVHIFIFAFTISLLVVAEESGGMGGFEPLFGLFLPFFWLYNIIDAARRASLYNLALAGGIALDFPEDFKLPKMTGSIPAGILLLAGGGLILSSTVFGISLAWIADWWPVAPIAIGAWLLFKGLQEKRAE